MSPLSPCRMIDSPGCKRLAWHPFGELGEHRRRVIGKERTFCRNSDDDRGPFHRDIRDDPAVDHVDDAIGDVEDAVVVGDDAGSVACSSSARF